LKFIVAPISDYKNEGYIGLRNGQIHHFDFRAPIVVSAVSAKHSMNGAVAGFEVVTNAFGCGRGLVTRALGKEVRRAEF
jgi:hypothetical protein